MDSYQISWKASAKKELRKIQPQIIPKIIEVVESLAADPYPNGCKKMAGMSSTYRIRKGKYRIIYSVLKNALIIEIIRVGHRQNIYE
ncbi:MULTISPECIES: type II toxin-antitoxin system RelE/ParE family toxin [Cyanophyceae]|uniref:type II toxin-antitoxin system RelE family toxin n=1 Tax=Cyanophyceae TaxID=3028117 RepID=UPI00016DCE76|nr:MULTISPECIES: type II toxin-antitoxin system RelE/ParE family toxin [Cyanophyceae]ACB00617.1 addiction module toxin, RelE/StbE family subfamily [Picosynechococcus sp. PCC 7002]SMH50851.1 mRNA interferase RelE/StbE [Picosynechococcus sp. OG1]SMQ81920.1 mRNA interferase RelE/StbE [Synechococcus sp. 7002]